MSGYKSGMKGADVLALLKNGLPIVDDVSKLDPNAELGSMATVVTAGSIQEVSLSELPQPDASIIDQTTFVLNASNCPLVSGLSVIVPTSNIPVTSTIEYSEMIYFISESMDLGGRTFGTMLGIMPLIQNGELSALMAIYMDVPTQTEQTFTLFSITDGVVTADQDTINQVNTLINGLHYVGAMEYAMQNQTLPAEVLAVYDMVVKAVAGIPSKAHIYLKKDDWEELYAKDFEKIASNIGDIETSVNTKADLIKIKDVGPSGPTLEPNTYYTCTVDNTSQSLSPQFYLLFPENNTKYVEHIIEIKITSLSAKIIGFYDDNTRQELPIIWANGIAPTFEGGMTYLISIANGFGVYSMFPNS